LLSPSITNGLISKYTKLSALNKERRATVNAPKAGCLEVGAEENKVEINSCSETVDVNGIVNRVA